MSWLTANTVTEANLAAKFLSRLSKVSLQEVRNSSCKSSGLLIDDEDVELAIRKRKLKTVLFVLNVMLAFSPASLLQNATLTFKRDSR